MRNHKRTFLLTILSGLLVAPLAYAVDELCDYRSNDTGGGNWASVGSWECYNGSTWVPCTDASLNSTSCDDIPPGASHTATILAGDLIYIEETQEAIATLIIQDGASEPGELELNTAADQQLTKLTIHSSLVMEDTYVPGKISFVDGSYQATPGELVIQGNAITAAGEIVAESVYEGGKITVNGTGFKITGDLSVTAGYLNVVGIVKLDTGATLTATGGITTFDGTFENDGAVTIGAGSVEFKGAGGIACDSAGTWTLNNSAGKLKVTTASTVRNKSGSITLSAGTIDVDGTFQFNGSMTWEGNTSAIEVAADKQFLGASGNLSQDCSP